MKFSKTDMLKPAQGPHSGGHGSCVNSVIIGGGGEEEEAYAYGADNDQK